MKEAGTSNVKFLILYIHSLGHAGTFQTFFSTKHDDSPQLAAMAGPLERRAMNVPNSARVEWCDVFGEDTSGNQIERVECLFNRLPFLFRHFDVSRTEWRAAGILDRKEAKSVPSHVSNFLNVTLK